MTCQRNNCHSDDTQKIVLSSSLGAHHFFQYRKAVLWASGYVSGHLMHSMDYSFGFAISLLGNQNETVVQPFQ